MPSLTTISAFILTCQEQSGRISIQREGALGSRPRAERSQLPLSAQFNRAHDQKSVADPKIEELAAFSRRLITKDAATKTAYKDLKRAGCCGRTLCVFLTAAVHALMEEHQSAHGATGRRRPAMTLWRFLLPASEKDCQVLPSKAISLADEIEADSEGILGSPCGLPVGEITIQDGGRKRHLMNAEINVSDLCRFLRRYAEVRRIIIASRPKHFPDVGSKNSSVTQANLIRYIRAMTKEPSYSKAAQLINGAWGADQGNNSARIVSSESLRKNHERHLKSNSSQKSGNEDSYQRILRRCEHRTRTSSADI